MVILLLSLGALVVFTFVIYRRLLQLRQFIGAQWAELESLLRQRHALIGDLLPQLRVLGNAGQITADSILMTQRVAAVHQASTFDQFRAETLVSDSLRHVIAMADESSKFRALPEYGSWRTRLEAIEGEISQSGATYNQVVTNQNQMLATFPISIVGGGLGFEPAHAMDLAGLLATVQDRVAIW